MYSGPGWLLGGGRELYEKVLNILPVVTVTRKCLSNNHVFTRLGLHFRPHYVWCCKILETCGGRVDVMHLHIGNHFNLGYTWETAREYYRTIMRDPDNINFVTIVREPREHMLSYFYCCMSPGMGYVSQTRPCHSFYRYVKWEAASISLVNDLAHRKTLLLEKCGCCCSCCCVVKIQG